MSGFSVPLHEEIFIPPASISFILFLIFAVDTLLIYDDKKEYIFTDHTSHSFVFEDSSSTLTLTALMNGDLSKYF